MNKPAIQAFQGLLWSGIALVIVGTLTIMSPWISSLAITIIVGIAALASGAVYVVQSFYDKQWSGFFWSLIAGIIAIIAGFLLIFRPLTGMVALALIFAGFLIFQGITKTIVAFTLRDHEGWIWLLLSGIAGIVLGGFIWYYWRESPITSSAWIISLLFGIDLLISGWSMIMLSADVRKVSSQSKEQLEELEKRVQHEPPHKPNSEKHRPKNEPRDNRNNNH